MKPNKISFHFGIWILQIAMLAGLQKVNAQSGSSMHASAPEKVFRAGAATSNISPFLGGGVVGNYGIPPSATHVHDELHARSLVLDDGTTKLAFLIVDNIGLNRDVIDEAKRLIQEEANIPMENLLVAATHTHSSVSAGGIGEKRRQPGNVESFDEYQRFLIRRMADAVRIAVNNLEPAQIGWGHGSVPQHLFIRRWRMKPGTPIPNPFGGQDSVVMNPGRDLDLLEPAGTPDPQVSFISVQSTRGKPIALLANYSLHYVGGIPRDHISADYFGVFAYRIQELLKADRQDPPFVGIMSNGTSGDVNNINFGAPPLRKAPYAQIKLVADDVAMEVFRVYKSLEYRNWVALRAAQEELTLQVRKAPPHLLERSRKVIARPDSVTPIHRHEITYAHRILNFEEAWPDSLDIILQTFCIGDLGIAAIPFEVTAEIGLEIKARSPVQPCFTIELASGAYGYLPTPAQHKLGGYETWYTTNRVEVKASEKILSTLLQMWRTSL